MSDDTYTDYGFRIMRMNTGANTPSLISHHGTGDLIIETLEAADILFETTNTTRMCIDSGGNVGIGNFNNPTANLHFYTTSANSNYIRFQNSEGNQYIRGDNDALHFDADNLQFRTEAGEGLAFINNNGFGVGGSPSVKLYVQSATNSYTDPSNNNIAGGYIYSSSATSSAHAVLAVRTNGASGGDPFVSFDISGVVGWHVGLDNSDSDKFKIGKSWSAVGANTALAIDGSYNAVFSGSVTATSFSGNGASVTNVNATTLDGIDSGSFLRSDANDTCSGIINFSGRKIGLGTTPGGTLVNRNAAIAMGDNDTGIAQNGDVQLELWANNVEVVNVDNTQVIFYGHAVPGSQVDLGTSGSPWRNLYINDLNMSNKGKQNDVDGTWGEYTIQEGHEDLYLLNHRTGKKFKFALIPVA